MMLTREFRPGELVWFDPGVGYVLPGEVVEFHRAAQVNITYFFNVKSLFVASLSIPLIITIN